MSRRAFALAVAIILVLTLASCSTVSVEESTTTVTQVEIETAPAVQEETTAAAETTAPVVTEASTVAEITTEVQTTEAITEPATEMQTTAPAVEDASMWDAERVVEFYKNAAINTGSAVKSEQTVGLQDISVNNGQLGGIFSFVTPILNSFFSSSTTVTDGITGEFEKLTVADVSRAAAYTASRGTVVEITLNPQTDSAAADRSDGSVAHGISVVGDLLSVMSQLKDRGLPIDISVENTVITYTNPVIKVLIDENGKIVNGTWKSDVEISLSDYKFAGSTVDSTRVVIVNKITVGGGFNAN